MTLPEPTPDDSGQEFVYPPLCARCAAPNPTHKVLIERSGGGRHDSWQASFLVPICDVCYPDFERSARAKQILLYVVAGAAGVAGILISVRMPPSLIVMNHITSPVEKVVLALAVSGSAGVIL